MVSSISWVAGFGALHRRAARGRELIRRGAGLRPVLAEGAGERHGIHEDRLSHTLRRRSAAPNARPSKSRPADSVMPSRTDVV
jgi:hypothetical protein